MITQIEASVILTNKQAFNNLIQPFAFFDIKISIRHAPWSPLYIANQFLDSLVILTDSDR